MDIALILLESLFIAFIAYYCIRKKTFFTKSSIIFFLPIVALQTQYFLRGRIAAGVALDLPNLLNCISASIKTFGFSITDDYVKLKVAEPLFAAGYYISLILAGFTTVSVGVGLFYMRLIDFVKLQWKIRHGSDIVIGLSDDSLSYIANNPNSVLWIDSSLSKDRLKQLFDKNIVFVDKQFSGTNLLKTLHNSRRVHLISFDPDYEVQLKRLLAYEQAFMRSGLQKSRFDVDLHLEIFQENISSVKSFLADKKELANRIVCFNRPEFIAVELFSKHPLTQYLGDRFVDRKIGAVHAETEINVFLIGYGRINREILKSSIIIHQLAQTTDGRNLEAKTVNYFAFDRQENQKTDKNRVHDYERYFKFRQHADPKDYLELPDPTHSFQFCREDINGPGINDFVEDIIQKQLQNNRKSCNFFFISFGTDLDNLDYARRIIDRAREESWLENPDCLIHVFPKVQSCFIKTNFRLPDNLSTPYGCDAEIMRHETIVNEGLYQMAKLCHAGYKANAANACEWNELSPFKKHSNIYATLGIKVKLNLLGFDYRSGASDGPSGLFDRAIGPKTLDYEKDYDVENKYTLTPRKVLAYIEHLRWNAFHIIQGYIPLPLKDAIKSGETVIKDKEQKRQHLCLTTYKGLDKYADLMALTINGKPYEGQSIKPQDAFYASKLKYEVYRYDFNNVDNIEEQLLAGNYTVCLL